ncbi:hypothetical protein AGOR_G00202410 [Albula goreensis]|uniref:Uncharacterized protein n=1 Tax=Albula goreensis TaxID=1534307 RepID=A0A8T3CTM4_9TELE|nr:hypothetical protein AGOR_G00202410 [Albula goreensis]
MMARVLLLLLGLLSEAQGDVRARDPELEEVRFQGHATWEHLLPQRFGTHGNQPSIPRYGPVPVSPVHPFVGRPEDTVPPAEEVQNHPARTGNWCSFVHRRTVTMPVQRGSQYYTVKYESPCPRDYDRCKVTLYKILVRPVYKEQQKEVTSLLWSCCPGYRGQDCEETDGTASDPHEETPGDIQEGLGNAHHQGANRKTHLSGGPNLEQRDFQAFGNPHKTASDPGASSSHDYRLNGGGKVGVASVNFPATPTSGTPPLHQATAALMAQLHPMLDGFNRTLRHLTQEVGRLSHGLAELKREQERGGAPRRGGGGGGHALKIQLQENVGQIDKVRTQLSSTQEELEGRLRSQQAMLHRHLTEFKADADTKIERNQAGLQSINDSLAEVKLKQRQLEEVVNDRSAERTRLGEVRPWPGPAVWEAVGKLESRVASNAARVSALEESSERAARHLSQMHKGLLGLEGRVTLMDRKSQSHFTDTAIDMKAAQAEVLETVNQLAVNLTTHRDHLSEMDSDMGYLQERIHGNKTPSQCDCLALEASVSELEERVASAMATANKNQRVLEEGAPGYGPREEGWGGSLSDLQQVLQQVQQSLAMEQDKTRTMQLNMSRLQAAQLQSQQEILALHQRDGEKSRQVRHLSSSFSSLLSDAIRHSEVLEVLLGEEVIEFKEHPSEEQKEYSIPLLRKRILLAQEQIQSHSITLDALGSQVANDDPSATASERHEREIEGLDVDYSSDDYSFSDVESLGKEVVELEARVKHLEGQDSSSCSCNCSSDVANVAPTGLEVELQNEVSALRRGLEDHLQVFRSVFGNVESVERPNTTLDLGVLWAMIEGKDRKRQKLKKERKEWEKRDQHRERKANLHSKRDTAATSQFPHPSVAFLAKTDHGPNQSGSLIFERVLLNHGRSYWPKTGSFRAPAAGVYLFALTLDFGPGPGQAILRREGTPVAVLQQGGATRVLALELRKGERVHLELARGTVRGGDSTDNTFAGLLVHRTT